MNSTVPDRERRNVSESRMDGYEKQGCVESHDPADRRQSEADRAPFGSPFLGKPINQDRDEDDIVDAENRLVDS